MLTHSLVSSLTTRLHGYSSTNSFHLITSDDTRVPVSKQLLAAHSTVFRDMIELPDAKEDECKVAESKEELELMITVLEGRHSALNLEQLRQLQILSDKYDSVLLREIVKSGCW